MKLNILKQLNNKAQNPKILEHEIGYNGTRFNVSMIHNKENPNRINAQISGSQNTTNSNHTFPLLDFTIHIPDEHFNRYYLDPLSLLKLKPEAAAELGIITSNFKTRAFNPRNSQELENMAAFFPITSIKTNDLDIEKLGLIRQKAPCTQTLSDDNQFSAGMYIG